MHTPIYTHTSVSPGRLLGLREQHDDGARHRDQHDELLEDSFPLLVLL